MKKKKCISLMAMAIGCLFLFACSNPADTNNGATGDFGDLPINIRAQFEDLPEGAKCEVYRFSKTGGGSYTLKDSIHLSGRSPRILAFNSSDWSDDDYRFLFIALPETSSITIENHLRESLYQQGELWENIRIYVDDPANVPDQLWYDILDKTSSDINTTPLISGNMKRLVGQMVLDIYRGEDVNQPEDIQDEEVLSVIDRVNAIEVTYNGLTSAIRFDDEGNVIPVSTHNQDVVVTYPIVTEDEFWRVPVTEVADENNPFLTPAATATAGSVRIGGIFGFPADNTVRVKAVFRYYDTTAHCGLLVHTHDKYCHERSDITLPLRCTLSEHTHTQDCGYDERSIVLNLPKADESELLTIMPNMYTVNKAAIRHDRIIDITRNGDFNMAFDWESNE